MQHGFFHSILASMAVIPVTQEQETESTTFFYKLGKFEVFTLVDSRRTGGIPKFLVGADHEMLTKYFPSGETQSQLNSFLIRGNGNVILVDSALGSMLLENLKNLNVSPDMVDTILITHMHPDHIGGLVKDGKALFPNATIYLADEEKSYWTKTNINQGVVDILELYDKRIKTFFPEELRKNATELLPGITPVSAFGHTPGHTIFMLESEGEKLLICGDLVHAELIQFAHPNVSVTYDTYPDKAVIVRKEIFKYVTENNIPIAGMHLVYPSIGSISSIDSEGFKINYYE